MVRAPPDDIISLCHWCVVVSTAYENYALQLPRSCRMVTAEQAPTVFTLTGAKIYVVHDTLMVFSAQISRWHTFCGLINSFRLPEPRKLIVQVDWDKAVSYAVTLVLPRTNYFHPAPPSAPLWRDVSRACTALLAIGHG